MAQAGLSLPRAGVSDGDVHRDPCPRTTASAADPPSGALGTPTAHAADAAGPDTVTTLKSEEPQRRGQQPTSAR